MSATHWIKLQITNKKRLHQGIVDDDNDMQHNYDKDRMWMFENDVNPLLFITVT